MSLKKLEYFKFQKQMILFQGLKADKDISSHQTILEHGYKETIFI